MGMIAAKHTDLVVGMDMHLIQPPAPAAPVMVPHPVAGMIMDPADYSPGACTVFINGLPRARAGTMCMMSPPHIPIGGIFVKPPLSEAEVYQGSSTVTADGEALSAMSHQVLGCHDTGAPAPVRKWKSGGAKSLMKAGSVVIAIPAGAPVFVGGAPTTSASGSDTAATETDFFAVAVVDEQGDPLAGASCRVRFANGAERAGVLDAAAALWLGSVPSGPATFVVSEGTRRSDAPAIHTVSRGDTIERIAWSHGFASFSEIWNAPENTALRERRVNAHALANGDALFIPDPFDAHPTLDTGASHIVRVRVPRLELKFRFVTIDDRPLARTDVELSSAERESAVVTTDDDGAIAVEFPVSTTIVRVRLHGDQPAEYEFVLGALEPTHDASTGDAHWSGIAHRLHALGFGIHKYGEARSERSVRRSLARFQREHLERDDPDGSPDEETLRSLRAAYGEHE